MNYISAKIIGPCNSPFNGTKVRTEKIVYQGYRRKEKHGTFLRTIKHLSNKVNHRRRRKLHKITSGTYHKNIYRILYPSCTKIVAVFWSLRVLDASFSCFSSAARAYSTIGFGLAPEYEERISRRTKLTKKNWHRSSRKLVCPSVFLGDLIYSVWVSNISGIICRSYLLLTKVCPRQHAP